MIGIKLLTKDNKVTSVSIGEGCLSILVGKYRDHFSLVFNGTSDDNLSLLKWHEGNLELGDKISIKIENVEMDSKPIDSIDEETEYSSLSIEEQNKMDMERYLEIEKILTERNILKGCSSSPILE